MVLPLDKTTRYYLENEGKSLAIHYLFGELVGRAVVWIKPGVTVANLGLYAATTYLALPIIARLTKPFLSAFKKSDTKRVLKDILNHALSLGASYSVLKYMGYSVSPMGALAVVVAAVAARYLSRPANDGYGLIQSAPMVR